MTEFVPSPEMVEAGARAILDGWLAATGYEPTDDDVTACTEAAYACLVAACTATVTEPCPTCGPDGDYAVDHLDATHRCPAPVCAWLSPFLNAGMLGQIRVWHAGRGSWEAAEIVFEDSGPLPEPDRGIAAFRVLPPATPGEGQ